MFFGTLYIYCQPLLTIIPDWMRVFDSLWPKQYAYYLEVASHIRRLTRLMRTEVRIGDFQQEDEFRKKALENFKTQKSESREQEYHRLMTSFSPCRYDATLYRLRGPHYTETGGWLFEDETFTQWLTSPQEGTRILWLKGIPGSGKCESFSECLQAPRKLPTQAMSNIWSSIAGKTVLCGATINQLRGIKGTKTAFTFLTYQEAKTSALSTIHSLIFQLAERDQDLMAIVCESMDNDLRSDLSAAGDILSSLVHYAGPVNLVIDGVDEISEEERSRLVTELLRLAEGCGTLRIILSSRPEADLTRLLDDRSVAIHIHDHNEGSIRNYVLQRIESYFRNKDIFPKTQVEIRSLLTPLASRAEGMFLYARLVMDMATDIQDLSELKKELTVLPESLDVA